MLLRCALFCVMCLSLYGNQYDRSKVTVSDEFIKQNTPDHRQLSFPKENYTLIKYLTTSCSICSVEIIDWKEFLSQNQLDDKLEVLFIVGGTSKIDIDYIFHQSTFEPTYFYDIDYHFMADNKISSNRDKQTLLVNSKGEIIDRGNPIGNGHQARSFKNKILNLN